LSGKIQKNLELETFLKILLVQILWREGLNNECLQLVTELLEKITVANRRSLDNYNALLYYYFVRIHEKKGSDVEIREQLLDALNKSCVRNDEIG
jgi:hypothetical protein